MELIKNYVMSLDVRDVQTNRRISIAPLFARTEPLEYLVLEEALKCGLNVKETRQVESLKVNNKTKKPVVILVGEYIVGGGQNRMVAANAFLEAEYKGQVPVRCVEHGRWNPNLKKEFSYGGYTSPIIRFAKTQQETWDKTSYTLHSVGAHSSSHDLDAAYRKCGKQLDDLLKDFQIPADAVGIATVMGSDANRQLVVDIFDQSSSMQKYAQQILKGYLLESLARNGSSVASKDEIRGFLLAVEYAQCNPTLAISGGKEFDIQSSAIEGSALVRGSRVIYVTYKSKPGLKREKQKPYKEEIVGTQANRPAKISKSSKKGAAVI